jgi:hypothetical protein
MLRPLVLLSIALPFWAAQVTAPQRHSTAPRPVKNVTEVPRAEEIEFVAFEFQQPKPMHVSVSLYRIDGEPSIGARYAVEANIGGQDAIATASFEVIDENGLHIQPLPIAWRGTGVPGHVEFVGVMNVPSQPFRIVLNGKSIDGRQFRRVYGRLFRPVNRPPARLQLPDIPPDLARSSELATFRRVLEEHAAQLVADLESYVAENATVPLVMPRTQVSKVMYAPLLSDAGRPIGMRVTYDVELSQPGHYNPALRVHPEYLDDVTLEGSAEMRVLDGSVEPLPRAAHAPHEPAGTGFGDNSVVAFGADFLYEANTVYHFRVDLVPSYVETLGRRTNPCVVGPKFHTAPDLQKSLARRLARDGPTTYRIYIGGETFEGGIENFYGEGTFYRSFVAEGTEDCPPNPR